MMTSVLSNFSTAFAAGLVLALTVGALINFMSTDETPVINSCKRRQTELSHRDHFARPNAAEIRVFCWITVPYTMPIYNMISINSSWARRCNGFAFVAPLSMIDGLNVPIIDVNISSLDQSKFNSIEWKRIWVSAWKLHSNSLLAKFDYYLLVQTASYVIPENIRHLVRHETPDDAFVMGRRLVNPWPRTGESGHYLSTQAGILLSRGAMRSLVERGLGRQAGPEARIRQFCGFSRVAEHYGIQLVECLLSTGVKIKDSRDSEGRERFHPVSPEDLLEESRLPHWLKNQSYHQPVKACMTCPSPESVTFVGVTEVSKTDALLYHVRPVAALN